MIEDLSFISQINSNPQSYYQIHHSSRGLCEQNERKMRRWWLNGVTKTKERGRVAF